MNAQGGKHENMRSIYAQAAIDGRNDSSKHRPCCKIGLCAWHVLRLFCSGLWPFTVANEAGRKACLYFARCAIPPRPIPQIARFLRDSSPGLPSPVLPALFRLRPDRNSDPSGRGSVGRNSIPYCIPLGSGGPHMSPLKTGIRCPHMASGSEEYRYLVGRTGIPIPRYRASPAGIPIPRNTDSYNT